MKWFGLEKTLRIIQFHSPHGVLFDAQLWIFEILAVVPLCSDWCCCELWSWEGVQWNHSKLIRATLWYSDIIVSQSSGAKSLDTEGKRSRRERKSAFYWWLWTESREVWLYFLVLVTLLMLGHIWWLLKGSCTACKWGILIVSQCKYLQSASCCTHIPL